MGKTVRAVDKRLIHTLAVRSASAVGALPSGEDVSALISAEVSMIMQVAALFGQKADKHTAIRALEQGVIAAPEGIRTGASAGIDVFSGLDAGYPFTIPAKIAVVTSVMEAVGNAAFNFFKKGGTLDNITPDSDPPV